MKCSTSRGTTEIVEQMFKSKVNSEFRKAMDYYVTQARLSYEEQQRRWKPQKEVK